MKALIAMDESPFSEYLLKEICKRAWPRDTEFKILTIIEPVDMAEYKEADLPAERAFSLSKRWVLAEKYCSNARQALSNAVPTSIVHYEIKEGDVPAEIVTSAFDWGADCILIGAHSKDICPHNLAGSVSKSVASYAPCSVEVIRPKSTLSPKTASSKQYVKSR